MYIIHVQVCYIVDVQVHCMLHCRCTCTCIHVQTRVGVGRMALKEDSGGSITERTIHHVGVASDPANVSHTCIHISRSVVKHILQRKTQCHCCTGQQ